MNSFQKLVHLVMYVMLSFHMSHQLHFSNTAFSIEGIFGKLMKYYNLLTSNVSVTFYHLIYVLSPIISSQNACSMSHHSAWMWVLRGKVFSWFFTSRYKDTFLNKLLSEIFWVGISMSHVLETAHQESWNSGMLIIREPVMREAHCEAWEDIQTCSPGKQWLVTEMKK